MVLVIRHAQLAALQRDTDARWYIRQLRGLYPAFEAASVAQRVQWVREGMQRAAAAGLGRAEMLQFLCFEQTWHPGCIDEPGFEWARGLLSQPGVPAADRMKALRHACVRRLLEAEAALENDTA